MPLRLTQSKVRKVNGSPARAHAAALLLFLTAGAPSAKAQQFFARAEQGADTRYGVARHGVDQLGASPQRVVSQPSTAPEERNDLVPAWESELVRNHAAAPASMRFRPGKGLEVKTGDGRFALITRLRAQFLYDYESVSGAEDRQAFQIRRARLQFLGNFWGKHNTFKVEFAVAPRDMARQPIALSDNTNSAANVVGTTPLLDWYVTFDHLRDLTLRVGQYKIPYSRQRVVSSGNLQFVDRAVTNAEFTLDRDLGLDFRSKDFLGLGVLKYYAGVYIGEGRNTSNKTRGAGDLGLMALGRIEVLPFGMFKDYSEADFERSFRPRLSIGAGYAYLRNAPGSRGILGSTPKQQVNYHNANADLLFKFAGLCVLSDFYVRKGRGGEDLSDGYGWMLQGGYLLPYTALEFGARYGMTRPRGRSSVLKGKNELGVVVGHYFAQHPLKVQADLFQLWNQGSKAGQNTRLRVQLQAAF
ncbi:MAG: OprO/OprP family phosphate-selective porin [Proteobacteria bacterium]|nr:OprO/OprP family phosphate-selective porin [Pseudomonadota bacterium]